MGRDPGGVAGTASAITASIRPKQWTKNLLLFGGAVFAGRIGDPVALMRAGSGFVAFCLLSAGVYLANDVRDADRDRLHERKRSRPVASGDLTVPVALGAAAVFVVVGGVIAVALGWPFAAVAASYLIVQVAYTLWLRDRVILDVMALATGFMLRAAAGGVVISAYVSPWMLACVALLALVLGLGKRRHELLLGMEQANKHRASLGDYTKELIDQMLSTTMAATIVTYALYTFFSPASERHGLLMFTVPFVVYGLFRYLYLVYARSLGGNPEDMLVGDVPLMIAIALWLAASVAAMLL